MNYENFALFLKTHKDGDDKLLENSITTGVRIRVNL